MLESTSLASLEELDQFLKNLSERVTYLEKVVLPSRVTKEELHTAVSGAKLFVMTTDGKLRAEIRLLKDQQATKADLEQLRQELSKQIADAAVRGGARPGRRKQPEKS